MWPKKKKKKKNNDGASVFDENALAASFFEWESNIDSPGEIRWTTIASSFNEQNYATQSIGYYLNKSNTEMRFFNTTTVVVNSSKNDDENNKDENGQDEQKSKKNKTKIKLNLHVNFVVGKMIKMNIPAIATTVMEDSTQLLTTTEVKLVIVVVVTMATFI